jgi:hypothetical protein
MIDIQYINLGEYPNDQNADSIYTAFTKVNYNFENFNDFFNDERYEDQIRDLAAGLLVNGVHTNITVNYIPLAQRLDLAFDGSSLEQNLVPGPGAYTLGTSTAKWSSLYIEKLNIGDAAGNIAIGTDVEFTGSNNLVIGTDAAPSDTSVSNEITLGNSSVDTVRIPGVDFIITNGELRLGETTPITNIIYNGDPNLGEIYTVQNPMPANQKLAVHGNMAVAGIVSAERVDTYLDAGFF